MVLRYLVNSLCIVTTATASMVPQVRYDCKVTGVTDQTVCCCQDEGCCGECPSESAQAQQPCETCPEQTSGDQPCIPQKIPSDPQFSDDACNCCEVTATLGLSRATWERCSPSRELSLVPVGLVPCQPNESTDVSHHFKLAPRQMPGPPPELHALATIMLLD